MRKGTHLTDDQLRAALTPRWPGSAPTGLLAAISAEVTRTPQQRWPLRLPYPRIIAPGIFGGRLPVVAWALLILTLLLAVLVGTLAAGALLRRTIPISGAEPGPEIGVLTAVSIDEAWATDDRGVWHYTRGAWIGPSLPSGFEQAWIRDLQVAPDGDVWIAAPGAGVAVLRDGRWTIEIEASGSVGDDPGTIAIAPDGTVWAAAQSGRLIGLQPVGSEFTGSWVECPVGGIALAVGLDGAVYLGAFAYAGPPGLARYDGLACARLVPPGTEAGLEVTFLGVDASGGLIIEALTPPWGRRLVRLDGGDRWTVLEGPDAAAGAQPLVMDASGHLWRIGEVGMERLEAGRWVEAARLPGVGNVSFAADGTAWVLDLYGIRSVQLEDVVR